MLILLTRALASLRLIPRATEWRIGCLRAHLAPSLPLAPSSLLVFSRVGSSFNTMDGPALPLGLVREDNSSSGLLEHPPGPGLSLTTSTHGQRAALPNRNVPALARIVKSYTTTIRKQFPSSVPCLFLGGRRNFGPHAYWHVSGWLSPIISGPQSLIAPTVCPLRGTRFHTKHTSGSDRTRHRPQFFFCSFNFA